MQSAQRSPGRPRPVQERYSSGKDEWKAIDENCFACRVWIVEFRIVRVLKYLYNRSQALIQRPRLARRLPLTAADSGAKQHSDKLFRT